MGGEGKGGGGTGGEAVVTPFAVQAGAGDAHVVLERAIAEVRHAEGDRGGAPCWWEGAEACGSACCAGLSRSHTDWGGRLQGFGSDVCEHARLYRT